MKKFATMIALVALFVLMALSASALQITGATIGNDNQDRVKNASQTFTVTNDGTSAASVTFSSTADLKYNVRFEPATVSLGVGESTSVKVIADIPLNFNAVEPSKSVSDYLKEKAFVIGLIEAKIGSATAASSELKMQAVNQLQIKKARLECGSKAQSLDDGDKVKNLRPDTQCSIEVEVENRFDDEDEEDANGNDLKIGDIEFDTVDIRVKVDDKDMDVNEDEDLDGLGADDKDSVTLEFDIDEDVDAGTYNMNIFVEGRDDNGAIHGERWTIKLEVERLTHDIQIRSPGLSPSKISACDTNTVRVTARVANIGKRDEDEVAVELNVADLKFSKRIDQIELDRDDSTSVNFVFDVPKKTKAGVYRAILNTFFDNTAPSNSQALEFTVEKCEEEQDTVVVTTPDTTTQTGQTGTTTQTGTQPTTPTSGAVAVPRARVTSSSGFTDSPAYLWLLGGMAVLLLIIIIALVVVAFRKPRQEML
jgi:hypothetical protein